MSALNSQLRLRERIYQNLPVDLAHEPPHEPGPVQEVVFVIASDGVHGEYDRFGTLALRPHYHIISIMSLSFAVSEQHRVQLLYPAAKKRRSDNRGGGGGDLHHSSDFVRFNPINL